jgi:hypothetical protein
MSTDTEITDQNEPAGDETTPTTPAEPAAPIDIDDAVMYASDDDASDDDASDDDASDDDASDDDASDDDASDDDASDDDASDDDDDDALEVGEWSLCASMIFLTGYLVVLMFWVLGHPVWETLISIEWEVYRTEFPVGVATILLLISVLSAFCALMSLVADKNNRRTNMIRLVTLGPLLPTVTAAFLIWVIVQRGAGNSILENFLG